MPHKQIQFCTHILQFCPKIFHKTEDNTWFYSNRVRLFESHSDYCIIIGAKDGLLPVNSPFIETERKISLQLA